MAKAKPHAHLLDVYGVELRLATTKREWSTLAKSMTLLDKKTPQSAGLVKYAVWEPHGAGRAVPHLVVWVDVKNHTEPGDLIDTCAHEAVHGANLILEHAGHDIRGVDEPHAYLTGWLTRWVWEACT